MARFEAIDFYNIDAHLSDEERMVRDAVRDWVSTKSFPSSRNTAARERFPKNWFRRWPKWASRGQPRRLRLRGHVQRRLRLGLAKSSSVATLASGALPPCRAVCACSRSTSTARKSSVRSIYPAWPPVKPSGAGLTEPDFGSNPGGMLTTMESTMVTATSSTAQR